MEKGLSDPRPWTMEIPAEAATDIDEKEYRRIVRLAARIAGVQEAQDIAQKTFLLALKSLPTFRRRAKFSTWLTRIAINVAISARKRQRRRDGLFVQCGTDDGDLAAVGARSLSDPRTEAEANERRTLVEAAIQSLPSKLLVPFVLRYYEGMTCREVARTLGHREGTVRYRVFRARQVLKEELEKVLR